MTPRAALFFVAGSLIPGLILLYRIDPMLCALGLAAAFSYNVLYTLWWKPRLPYAAIPGAIPGALPALMGFVAAHRTLKEPGGWFLFLLLFFWQMPHFWVLAIRYREDYRKGGIPTLPVAKGAILTVGEVLVWGLAYVGIALMAPLFLPVSKVYLGIAILMSAKMLWELKLWSGDAEAVSDPERKTWLRFFLWINLSLIVYLAALVADLWGVYLVPYMN
jgi:protoheme IX farnesyltransferase